MVIQSLKVILEEAELAAKVRDLLGGVSQLKEATLRLVPGAAEVGGKFQVGFAIPFETRWTVEVLQQGHGLGVRLAHVSVGMIGLSAALLTTQVMSALAQKLRGTPGVTVENSVIVLELSVLLGAKGIRLEAPVRRVGVAQGCVEIEIG